jgi:ElaA protein
MNWTIKSFEELTNLELYNILAARCEVFIVGQGAYQDPDGVDIVCDHLYAREGDEIAAYCRIVPAGVKYAEASIGRVIAPEKYRGRGLGRALMERAIAYLTEELGETAIRISGQAYLQRFYESLGFKTVSEPYLEDDIPHLEMLYQKSR